MKNIIKRTLTTLGAATALLLSSCIDIKQEVWINADGGGRLVLDMGISKQTLTMLEGFGNLSELAGEEKEETGNPLKQDPAKNAEKLKDSEYVTDVKWEEKEDEKYKRTIYTIEITDITKIGEIMKDNNPLGNSLEGLLGDADVKTKPSEGDEFNIEKTSSGTYKLSAISKGQPQEEQDPVQAAMMKQMFGDAKLTVHVHAPAISHNGKEHPDGGIVWAMPLADAISGFELKGEFEASGSGSNMNLLLILAGVIVLLIVVMVTKAKKAKVAGSLISEPAAPEEPPALSESPAYTDPVTPEQPESNIDTPESKG